MTIDEACEILNVNINSSIDEIKRNYKKLVLENHPDRFSDEKQKKEREEKLKKINEAYNVLSGKQRVKQDYFNNIHDDFFDYNFFNFFSNGFWNNKKSSDANFKIVFSLDELLNGTKKMFEVINYEICDKCNGQPFTNKTTCTKCKGSGVITEKRKDKNVTMVLKTPCIKCNGRGFIAEKTCEKCNGSGRIRVIRKFVVNIPKAEEITTK